MDKMYLNQVRLLLRVLPLVAEENDFALKGGTAINLFERNLPRLSVDIDLTYLPFDDRAAALANVGAALARIKDQIEQRLPDVRATLVEQSGGVEAKLHCQYQKAQIKIEVNTVMRGHIFEPRVMACADKVQDMFESFAEIAVVSHAELYGGKLCAALDRQHPRDLFDVHNLLSDEGFKPGIKQGFIAALLSHPRPIYEVLFPALRDQREIFDAQFAGMAFEPFSYDDYLAARIALNKTLRDTIDADDKAFLLSFKGGTPDWSLTAIPVMQEMPAIRWKLANIQKLKAQQPDKHGIMLAALAERLSGV